jgi:hypothetical protein
MSDELPAILRPLGDRRNSKKSCCGLIMQAPVYLVGADRSSDELRQFAASIACGHTAGRFHHPGGKASYRPSRDGTLIEGIS